MTTKIFGLGLVAATAAFSLLTVGASAQQPPPAAAAPAKVAPKSAPTPPPVKVEAPAKVAPKAAAAKAADPSPCKGLVETACKAKAELCGWIVPTKVDAKSGAADKAYCRKVAGIAKKDPKVAPKAEVKAAPAAPKAIEKAAVPKATTKAVPPPAAAKAVAPPAAAK